MDKSEVKLKLKKELVNPNSYNNWHGITEQNINNFIVEPFAVSVDPDDLETENRMMWVVLQMKANLKEGYAIAFDPLQEAWSVIEYTGTENNFIQVVAGESLAEALDSM